ncbi:MAG: MTH938/NDUFAF3 family protein [Anaerolineae bacterium]
MFHDSRGPIEAFAWGVFTIAGQEHGEGGAGAGKDIRLVGTEVSAWVERQGHTLTPEMITGVYGRADILIIGSGVHGLVQCPEEVRAAIAAQGIADLRVLPTPEACPLYNQWHREGRRVAMLAHGTC